MTIDVVAGTLLIVAPLWFNTTFALLGKRFEYPDILRRPPGEILDRFRAGGSSLILLWWAFMLSGLLFIAAAVVLGQSLGLAGVVPLAVSIGVLAGLVQMLGLLRWVYLVPSLARTYADPTSRAANVRPASPCSARCISTSVSASASIWATSSPGSGRS